MMVRKIQVDDVPVVIEMLREFHAWSGVPGEFSEHDIQETIHMIAMSDTGVCLVADVDGRVVGTCAGIVSGQFFNRSCGALTELWLWVPEEFRRHGVARALIQGLEGFGRDLGCASAIMASLSGTDSGFFFESAGYRPLETHYVRGL